MPFHLKYALDVRVYEYIAIGCHTQVEIFVLVLAGGYYISSVTSYKTDQGFRDFLDGTPYLKVEFHQADLDIWSGSREGETQFYGKINVILRQTM